MAGIGFELRRLLERNTYGATLSAYLYAGLVSSGPWVLSILSLLFIGILSIGIVIPETLVTQFLVSVTYLISFSLIFTGGFQLMFTRFVADRLFDDDENAVLPNLLGLLFMVTVTAGAVATLFFLTMFDGLWIYRLLMITNFVVLANMWIVVIFMSSTKQYKQVLLIMACGYGLMLVAALYLRHFSMEGLLVAFLLGHSVLLFALLYLTFVRYPSDRFMAWDFLDREKVFYSLFFTGVFYYLGIWVDKYLFWFNPLTSVSVIGPLNASRIYDIPIFLAYLSIIPALAVFLVRIETDFAQNYDEFYKGVRNGESLGRVYELKDRMTFSIRQGVFEIFKIQGITVLIIFLFAPDILRLVGIADFYLPLFFVDVIGASVQVLFMSLLNVLFYFDRRREVLQLTIAMFLINATLTPITQYLGPAFFGYGFTVSVSISTLLAMMTTNRVLHELEYETFMLQR